MKFLKSRLFRYLIALKVAVKALVLLFLLNSCMTYQDVQFQSVSNFKVEKVNKEGVKLMFDARVHNPNSYNISVRAKNLDLGIGGQTLASADLGKKVKIKKNTTDSYPVEVLVNIKDLMKGLGNSALNLLSRKSVKLEIAGNAKVSAKGLSKSFPITFEYPINLNDLNLGGFDLFK